MAEPALGTSVTAEILSSLPQGVDPLALSLNESPFPPLPAVRSALAHCLDVANRYPEFLPGQLRRMIADRVGVDEDQVVLGAGASGVAVQVLHAVTRPGDRIVMSTPTFDGYPIFAEMARLTQVTVPLDKHGYQDLAAMAEDRRPVHRRPGGTTDGRLNGSLAAGCRCGRLTSRRHGWYRRCAGNCGGADTGCKRGADRNRVPAISGSEGTPGLC